MENMPHINNENYISLVTAAMELAQNYYDGKSFDNEAGQVSLIYDRLSGKDRKLFYHWISEVIEDISQRILIISAVYRATNDECCLNAIEDLILSERIDYDLARSVDFQILTQRFIHGYEIDYIRQRSILESLKDKLSKLIDQPLRYISPKERNKNRIIIITDQLILSQAHAPSKMVRELCEVLKNDLGLEIVLLVPAELTDIALKCYNVWIDGFVCNYLDIWGDTIIDWENLKGIRVIQTAIDSNNLDGLRNLISFVYEYNPMYIWHVGDQLCTTELLCDITTVVATPCNAGIAVSKAPYLIRYMGNTPQSISDWVGAQGQEISDIKWGSLEEDVMSYTKGDMGFEDDSFLIAIMGNRLDTEIDQGFISVMKDIVRLDPCVKYVLIGNCSIDFGGYGLSEYVRVLGYRADYLSLLKSCDLVLNPRRRGAGACAVSVCYMTPVITLDDSDVASLIDNKAFIASSYEEYPVLVHRYVNDEEYRRQQMDECIKTKERLMGYSLSNEIQKADHNIRSKINCKNTTDTEAQLQIEEIQEMYDYAMIAETLYKMIDHATLGELDSAICLWEEVSKRIRSFISDTAADDIEVSKKFVEMWKQAREETWDLRRLSFLVEQELIPAFRIMLSKKYGHIETQEGKWKIESTSSGFLTIKSMENGKYLHSLFDPMREADILACRLYDPRMDSFHILGCGLGYLPFRIWEQSCRTAHIYIYEDDKQMIEYAREIGVLSWIDEDHITVIDHSDLDSMLGGFLENTGKGEHNFYISDWKLGVYADSRYGTTLDTLDFNERTRQMYEDIWTINARENAKQQLHRVEELKGNDEFSGRDCVIVSAGPSLDDNIEFLRGCKGKKLIIAINAVLKRLAYENIKPDIIVMLDPKDILSTHIEGVEDLTEGVPLVFPINGSQSFVRKYRGEKYTFYDFDMTSDGFEWNFGGTVASLGLDLAYYLNATKVYLVGSDLAFSGGKNYAEGLVHGTHERLNGYLEVDSTDGSKVATYQVYNILRSILESQIVKHSETPVINMALHGAKISGSIPYQYTKNDVSYDAEIYEGLLSDINEFAKRYFSQEDYGEYTDSISGKYTLLSVDEKDKLFEWIAGLFADDLQIQIMIISAIYHATFDPDCLSRIEGLLLADGLPYDMAAGLWRCTLHERFRRGFDRIDYIYERKIVSALTDRFGGIIRTTSVPVPPDKRDNNRVVIVTEQLLSESHAPSRFVYTICDVLQNRLGYEVLLVVATERSDSVIACADVFFDIYMTNYNDNIWGLHDVKFRDGLSIRTLQFHMSTAHLDETVSAYQYICDFNPLYVWNVGDPHIFAELFGDITSLVSMPLNAGLAVSDATILVRYMRRPEREIEEYVLAVNQTVIDMSWYISPGEITATPRSEVGLAGDRFLIAVMGNRLDTEIDQDFLNIMCESVSKNPIIVFVIIGECSINFESYGLIDNVIVLGFRKDYMNILKMCDICVNPRRRGGGGASEAILFETPVITLDDCDVASAIDNKAFICEKYEDFSDLIDQYINNSTFMDKQRELCRKIYLEKEKSDINLELTRVDNDIRRIISKKSDEQ